MARNFKNLFKKKDCYGAFIETKKNELQSYTWCDFKHRNAI